LLIAAAVSAALSLLSWRRRPAAGATPFALLMLGVADWSLAYALELASAGLAAKLFWTRIEYLGIASVSTFWLLFALQYTGRERWLTRRNLSLLAIIPLAALLLVWTDNFHHLFYSAVRLDTTSGAFPMLIVTYSVAFWINTAYSYLLLLLATFLLVQALVRTPRPRLYRGQVVAVLVGVLMPWLGNASYIFGLSPILDLTPFAFTLTGLAVAWSLFRFRLLDITPAARDVVFQSMSDGVIALDVQDRIVDLNPAAERIIGRSTSEIIGQPISLFLSDRPDLLERYLDATETQAEIVLGEGETQWHYDLRISPLVDRLGRLTGRLVVLRDITERVQADEERRRQAEALTALHETALELASRRDLPDLLQAIAARAVGLLGARGGGIYLYRPDTDDLELSPEYNVKPDFSGVVLKRGEGLSGKVLETGRPMAVDDYSCWEGRAAQFEGTTFDASVSVPVYWGDRPLGVINILDNAPRTFSPADIALLERFAPLAAAAMEQARLLDEAQARWREAETLRQASAAVTETLSLDETLTRILEQLERVVPYDSACVFLLEGNSLRSVAARGFLALEQVVGQVYLTEDDVLFREMQSTRRPLCLADVQADPRFCRWGDTNHVRGWMGAPLVARDNVIGCLTIDSRRAFAYGEVQMGLAQAFANQAAVAIENARLYRDAQQRLAALEMLRRTSLQITSLLDLPAVLDSITESALALVGATDCHIYLYDEASETFAFGTALWENGRREPAVKAPRSGGLTATVAREARPIVINDASRHPFYASVEARKWEVQAVAGFPLKQAGRVVGVFTIAFVKPHTFSQDELQVLGLLADQAAIAIENARLYQETRQRATELSILYETTTSAMTSVRLDDILDRVVAALRKALQPDRISIQLVELETDELVVRAWSASSDGPQLMRCVTGVGATGRVVETGEPVLLADVREAERYYASDPATRSELCVPLRVGRRVIGALNLESCQLAAFDEDDLRLLSILAGHLAAVLENARLVEGLESEVAARTAEIRDEQEKSETILRSVGDAIAMTDPELKVRYVNPAFTSLTGYPAEEILGQDIHQPVFGSISNQNRQSLLAALAREESWQGELTVRRKDGRLYEAALTIAPIRDAEGRLTGYVSSHEDISRFKELDRARSQFMTNVSHQLRTPVTNMKLYAHLLRQGTRPDKTERYLQVLEEQAERLGHLVQDFLEITTLDSGQTVTAWKPILLSTMIQDVLTRYQSQSAAACLTLEALPLPPDLPVVRGDQARLTQALNELVENAIVFTSGQAGGRVRLEVETVEDEEQLWVTIAVRDTGPGISAEEQAQIFDRFYRGSLAESGHVPGTGLGLSMAQEILQAHGGRVTVESIVGQGSVFTLWLRGGKETR